MKHLFAILPILCLALFSFKQNDETEARKSKIYIRQHGALIDLQEKILLKKEPFELVFDFHEDASAVLLNASFKPESYARAKKDAVAADLRGFGNTAMAECLNNQELEMLISDDSPSYWYYDSEEDNRFDKVERSNNRLVCTRTINRFFDVRSERKISITGNNKPLYLVLIPGYHSLMRKEDPVLDRIAVCIEWEKEAKVKN